MQFLTTVLLTATTMIGATMVSAAPTPATLATPATTGTNCPACLQSISACVGFYSQPRNAQEAQSIADHIKDCLIQGITTAVCITPC
ncbi:MAG: hypothetical protein M1826_003893 [Phylliscum demangeonii]|nr:MAG: hypothetical protein M1826_003893 [Phylliscum demangeonii]